MERKKIFKSFWENIKQCKLMSFCLLLLYVFNLHDIVWTHELVTKGYAREINPVMKFLLDVNPLLFIMVKFHLMLLIIFFLWKNREFKRCRITVYFITFVYGILVAYQLIFLSLFFKYL